MTSCTDKNHKHTVSIDILPDNVLLEIFSFCIDSRYTDRQWQRLVHVCQRWRGLIFASPRRLDLHLKCSFGTPVRKNLIFWPVTLPLVVNFYRFRDPISPEDEDNVVAALEHPSRVRHITIVATAPLIKKLVTILWKPFPALTWLHLECKDSTFPVISRRFLGGSRFPRLGFLYLKHISFPRLPLHFSSARNLATLDIGEMPANGYILPDAMVRTLAVLPRLDYLSISFCQKMSLSDLSRSQPHPQMRTIHPALTCINYRGRSEYLEDFLARIDTPEIDAVIIEYSNHQIEISQLLQFIERTENLKIDQFARARVQFTNNKYSFALGRSQEAWCECNVHLQIEGEASIEAQVEDMAHLIGRFSSTFSKVDDLFAHGDNPVQTGGTDITKWLPLFRLFPAVETLRLSGRLAVYVTSALEDATEEMVTDVFPALSLIRIAESEAGPGPPWDKAEDADDWMEQVGSMKRFLSLRQLSGCSIRVINPEDELAEVEDWW